MLSELLESHSAIKFLDGDAFVSVIGLKVMRLSCKVISSDFQKLTVPSQCDVARKRPALAYSIDLAL